MKIHKVAELINPEDVPHPFEIATYIEALAMFRQDNPELKLEYVSLIDNLPSSKQVKKEYSEQECGILFETINYLWKKITGNDIIEQSRIQKAPETLSGNFWLINNGILLEGINHYGIIKHNSSLLSTLLRLNGFAVQQYLSTEPNKLIYYIVRNGGVRMFVDKNKRSWFQMTERTYAIWGKSKVKKFQFKEKIVKIIDPKAPYKGWTSGISIKL